MYSTPWEPIPPDSPDADFDRVIDSDVIFVASVYTGFDVVFASFVHDAFTRVRIRARLRLRFRQVSR